MRDQTITLEAMPVVAQELLSELATTDRTQAIVVGLSGNLGAGKTTLVQAIAAELGVEEHVQSPTFVIMKQYATTNDVFTTLVHIDAYRIEDVSELAPLHFSSVLIQPQTLVCIEWPEHIASAIPASAHQLYLKVVDTQTRQLSVTLRESSGN